MQSLPLILAVLALTTPLAMAKGDAGANECIHENNQAPNEFHDKEDAFTYSFYETLRSGEIQMAVDLMMDPTEDVNVITSLTALQQEVIAKTTWLMNVQELSSEALDNVDPLFFVAKGYFYSEEINAPGPIALKVILKALNLLIPMETITKACEILCSKNADISLDVKRSVQSLSETLAYDWTAVRYANACGKHRHKGARKYYTGEKLPLYLLSTQVYHNPYFKTVEQEETDLESADSFANWILRTFCLDPTLDP
jgi:hypothetical protein